MATREVRHIGVSIERPPADVYGFASSPANLPLWAKGLSGSIANVGGEWLAESPLGKVKVRFAAPNALGGRTARGGRGCGRAGPSRAQGLARAVAGR